MTTTFSLDDLYPFHRKWIEANRSVKKLALRMARQGSSPDSIGAYVYDVAKFAEQLGGTPDEVLTQSRDWASEINSYLDDMIAKRGASPQTGQRRYSAIKRWLTVNEVEAKWEKVEVPRKEARESGQVPKKEELRLILGAAGLVDKVLVLVAVSSALRVGSITKLQLKYLDLSREVPPVKVPKEITKNRKSFVTFVSPEAKQAIEAYLREREHRGELLCPDSYLVTTERPRGKRLLARSVQDRWENMLRRVNLYRKASPDRRWHVFHFHLLRKYYKTWATLSGMNSDVVEYTMGHRSGIKNLYFIPDEAENVPPEVLDKLEEEYRKAIPALTVTSDEDKLREQEARITEQAMNLKAKEGLIDQLTKRLDAIEAEVKARKVPIS